MPHSDLISVQFRLSEGLDAHLLKCDDDETDEHVEEDQGHGAHVEEEEDEGERRGARSRTHWFIGVLEQLRVVGIVHHAIVGEIWHCEVSIMRHTHSGVSGSSSRLDTLFLQKLFVSCSVHSI